MSKCAFTQSANRGSSQSPSQGPWYARTPEGGGDDSLGRARLKWSNDSRLESRIESRIVESRIVFDGRPDRIFEIGSVLGSFFDPLSAFSQHSRYVPKVKAGRISTNWRAHHLTNTNQCYPNLVSTNWKVVN